MITNFFRKTKFVFLFSIFVFSLILISVQSATAADLEISCDSSSCVSTPLNGKIFNEKDILPTHIFTRTLKAINTSSNALDFAIEVKQPYKINILPSLSKVIDITINEVESGKTVYGPKTIDQWRTDGFVILSNIPAGAERNYQFIAAFANVGNEYQGRELVFDLKLGFDALPAGDGGNGSVTSTASGGEVKTPVCTATAPSSAPTLSAVQGATPNTVILAWTGVTPVTHYTIRYGDTSGSYLYGANNVGNVGSFVVSALSSGSTYYFQVAGVNDCAPGPWSNEASASPLGLILPSAPAPSFTEILGVETEASPITIEEGPQVAGASTCSDRYYWWWAFLILQTILTVIFFLVGKKRGWRLIKFIFVTMFLAAISQLVHQLCGCNCATGAWCPRYLIFNLVILIVSGNLYFLAKKK